MLTALCCVTQRYRLKSINYFKGEHAQTQFWSYFEKSKCCGYLEYIYLSVSKQFIYASLVEKTPLVQKRPILQLFKDGDLEMRWPRKLGQFLQNHNISSFCHNDTIAGIHCSIGEIIQKKLFGQNLTFQSAGVSLKIRSRSPKCNKLLTLSQQNIYASLVKIEDSVWKWLVYCCSHCGSLWLFCVLL